MYIVAVTDRSFQGYFKISAKTFPETIKLIKLLQLNSINPNLDRQQSHKTTIKATAGICHCLPF